MTWLRLDASTFQDRSIRRTGRAGRLAFVAAITMTKTRDWKHGERRGYLPAKDFLADEIAVWFGEDASDPETVAFYQSGIDALQRENLIEPVEDGWIIPNWTRYQPDPGAAERMKDYRERNRELGQPYGIEKRDEQGRYRNKARRPQKNKLPAPPITDVTGVTGTRRDVTGRDVSQRPVHDKRSVSGVRPAASGSPLGGSPAASPSGAANGNGHPRILSPAENHERLAQALAPLDKPEPVYDQAAFEARRAASLAALAAIGDPTCESPPPPSSTKTSSGET